MDRLRAGDGSARGADLEVAEVQAVATRFDGRAPEQERERRNLLGFLSCVVHDLRNSICVLRLSTTPTSPPLSPRELRRTVALVRRQLDGLERMADDLLDVTRIEAGQLELRIEERDASAIASGVCNLYRTGFTHTLTLAIPERPVPIRCDPVRIEQVLCNLVSNAIRYSAPARPIHVSVMQDGGEAVLSVADRGIGIAAHDLGRIFEPFHRAENGRPLSPGSGLGLSVARRIVEAHRGRIDVESTPGQGSVFSVRLPLSPELRA